MSIEENVRRVQERVKHAAERSGRQAANIAIVAVSKTHSSAAIEEAIRSGIVHIGENRIQEALEKYGNVKLPAVWHMVGHLQRNKVKSALSIFSVIHSVDSISLAAEIDKRTEKPVDVLVEVNIGGEDTKSGVMPDETKRFIRELRQFRNVQCKGLMAVPPWFEEAERVRPYFKELAQLLVESNRMNVYHYPLTDLSMGMTDDFEIAIEEGATIVRIGRAIFGERLEI